MSCLVSSCQYFSSPQKFRFNIIDVKGEQIQLIDSKFCNFLKDLNKSLFSLY